MQQLSLFDNNEYLDKNIFKNAFDWTEEFPQLCDEEGNFEGFDVVIGNPPYGVELKDYEKKFFNENYQYQDYQLDTYLLFIERAFQIIPKGGIVAFIIPNTWLTNLKFKKIRRFITEQIKIHSISHYNKYVFPQAVVDTQVVVLQNTNDTVSDLKVRIYKNEKEFDEKILNQKNLHLKGETINIFLSEKEKQLCKKIEQDAEVLDNLVKIVVGLTPYRLGYGKPKQTKRIVANKLYDANNQKNDSYKPLLRGSDIHQYTNKWNGKRWIKYGDNLAEPRYSANFDANEKIVMRQTGDRLIATIDTNGFVCLKNMHIITSLENSAVNLKYLLALLNSKLLDYYHQYLNPERGEALAEIKKQNVGKLPIKIADTKTQTKIVDIVTDILHKKGENQDIEINKDLLKLDKMVYKIYHLTTEEIQIIERVTK